MRQRCRGRRRAFDFNKSEGTFHHRWDVQGCTSKARDAVLARLGLLHEWAVGGDRLGGLPPPYAGCPSSRGRNSTRQRAWFCCTRLPLSGAGGRSSKEVLCRTMRFWTFPFAGHAQRYRFTTTACPSDLHRRRPADGLAESQEPTFDRTGLRLAPAGPPRHRRLCDLAGSHHAGHAQPHPEWWVRDDRSGFAA